MTWIRTWRSALLIALVAFVLALPAMAVASGAGPTGAALRIDVLSAGHPSPGG